MTRLRSEFHLAAPALFHFKGTAYSHGWVVLAPNAWDKARGGELDLEGLREPGASTAQVNWFDLWLDFNGEL